MTSAAELQDRRPEWRNRPGRDLLVALGICYFALAAYGVWHSGDISVAATSILLVMLAPIGFLMSLAQMSGASLIGAIGLIAGVIAMAVRLHWYVRIPLLVAVFAAIGYSAAMSGMLLS